MAQEGSDAVSRYLTALKQKMGGTSALYFSCFNPNGRYRLDLSNDIERRIAKNLLVIGKGVTAKVTAKELCDRSQRGNGSCFRNERVDGYKFEMTPMWALPQGGIFEFDFVTFA